MPPSTLSTLVRAMSPDALVDETVARLGASGAVLRAGVVYASQDLPHAQLSARFAQALPGVEWVGVSTSGPGPALAGLWLTGDVRAVVATGTSGRALADAAIERAGFPAFKTRLALLHATACAPLLPGLFEVLPKGVAFVGADVTRVWTAAGAIEAALLVADWQTNLSVGFEGATNALAHAPAASAVGLLRLRTGAEDELPAAFSRVSQTVALVRALAGVPDRSPPAPTTATLLLTDLKARAEG